MADLRNYVLLVDKQGKEVLPVTDGKAVFVGDGSVKLNDQLTSLEGQISTNAGEIARVEKEYKEADLALDGKIGAVEGRVTTLESDKADKTQVAQDIATAKQELTTEIEKKANVADLGTAAYKNIGNAEGNIPVLGANGKLDESMIPAIAINEHFDAESQEAAMLLTVQNGDMVFIVDTTYICVNALESTFEKRFRPLTSVTDAITKGEVESKLATKVDNVVFEAYKTEVQGKLDAKVENSVLEAYKLEVEGKLNDKANATEVTEAINGVKATAEGADAKANKNASDLAEYKIEVEGLLTGKSNEGHTHEEYALGNEVEEVRGLVNSNTSAIATKVEQSAFDSYKEEVTGALANKADATHDHEEYALKAEMGAVSGLATSAKDTVVNAINEVKGMADANASAVATKVETETFNTYKGEVDGKIALKADQTALEELGGQLEGCIRFRTVEIDSFTLA